MENETPARSRAPEASAAPGGASAGRSDGPDVVSSRVQLPADGRFAVPAAERSALSGPQLDTVSPPGTIGDPQIGGADRQRGAAPPSSEGEGLGGSVPAGVSKGSSSNGPLVPGKTSVRRPSAASTGTPRAGAAGDGPFGRGGDAGPGASGPGQPVLPLSPTAAQFREMKRRISWTDMHGMQLVKVHEFEPPPQIEEEEEDEYETDERKGCCVIS